jgi:hypothetical protein
MLQVSVCVPVAGDHDAMTIKLLQNETSPHHSKTNVESCIRGDGCHAHWFQHQISSKSPDDAHDRLQAHPLSPCLIPFGGMPACHTAIIPGINPLASEESGSQTQSTVADSMTMSIKEMKEEPMCLGGNAKGCVERPDMQARLLEARAELLELRAASAIMRQVPEFYSDELYPAAAADILGSAVSKKQTPSPPASPYAPAPLPSSPDCILWRMGQGIGMAAAQRLPPVSMAPKEFVSTAQVAGLHFLAPTLAPTQVCQWSCILAIF